MAVAPHTARLFVLSTYVWRLPSINVLINTLWLYGLTTLFLPKHLWGSLSAFCNYPQRCNLEDLFQPFALSPRFFTNWSNLSSLPPTSVLIIHSLTVRFDHTFFPKHLWGSISAFCNYPQRFQSWGSLSAFCTIPKIFTNWSNLPVSEHL